MEKLFHFLLSSSIYLNMFYQTKTINEEYNDEMSNWCCNFKGQNFMVVVQNRWSLFGKLWWKSAAITGQL